MQRKLFAGELAPANASVQDTLGWVYYRRGNYAAAVEHLKLAVANGPTASRQYHLAICYIKAGKRDLGQTVLWAALRQDPNLPNTEKGW